MKLSKKLFLSIMFLLVLLSSQIISSVGASSVVWSQIFGGGAIDVAEEIVQTSDGGYAVAGWTGSIDGSDFWLIKIDSFGNMEWNRTYGEEGMSYASSLIKTSDGGFVIAGRTKSFGAGESDDLWLIKTDSTLTPTPTPEPESFPTTIVVASIATIAVIATGILVYIKKYKK